MEFASADDLKTYASSTGRTYVSIALEQSGKKIGSMILELFTDLNPKTCAHFLQGVGPNTFKGGFKYAGTPIHRIVKHAYIQGGDVVDGTGKGDPGFSIADETFAVMHSEAGLLGLATSGEPHTASTQFYITLAGPLKWLDGKRVVFGKVVDQAGLDTLRRVEALTTNNERPLPELIVTAMQVVA
ncbi:cyclophilin-like domain-containing protein [Haematococcus lacustris]